MPWAVAAAVVGGVVGAVGSNMAASKQAGAANNAAQIQENEFNTITQQEQPFMQGGYGALNALNYGLGIGNNAPGGGGGTGLGYGSLTTPFTAQNFKQLSPAYQFQMQQGQQGVLNADSGGQGALSGAALKDLTGFNQNLANTSFNNAFNQYQTQQGNIYNRLSSLASLGQNAAANTGQQGTQLAGNAGQAVAASGAYTGAGYQAAGNALGNGISNLGSIYAAYGGGGRGGGVDFNNSAGSDYQFSDPNTGP